MLKPIACLVVLTLVSFAVPAANAADSPDQRRILNEGYSLLYDAASGIAKSDLAFLVKVESQAVEEAVTAVADYTGRLTGELERIAEDYPAVRIDLDPLPVMEKRKREEVAVDRILSFAPVFGRSGPGFERTILLSLSGAINQQRQLAQVMAEAEPNDALKAFLERTRQRYDELYERVVVLLNEQYFKHDSYEPSE